MGSTRRHGRAASGAQPLFPAPAYDEAPYVLLSLGLGIESCAILVRWLLDPTSRNFPLERLIVITAMLGDEFGDTGSLVRTFILPLMREHNVRYVQVARAGPSFHDGYVVLDDSRQPNELHLAGRYKLSDELFAAGTVPQVAHGKKSCSIKHKGFTIGCWINDNLRGAAYRHAIGFNRDEVKRIDRDNCYGAEGARMPFHPLLDWGWSREDAWAYLMRTLGISWKRSACSFCCFSGGRPEVLNRFRELPEAGLRALLLERVSLSLNPRMTLYSNKSLYTSLQADHNTALLEEFESVLNSLEWSLYRVRRAVISRRVTHRKVESLAKGSRDEMAESLARRADNTGRELSHEADIPRVYIKRRSPGAWPDTEEMLVAAPALAIDKGRKSFERSWAEIGRELYAPAPLVQLSRAGA